MGLFTPSHETIRSLRAELKTASETLVDVNADRISHLASANHLREELDRERVRARESNRLHVEARQRLQGRLDALEADSAYHRRFHARVLSVAKSVLYTAVFALTGYLAAISMLALDRQYDVTLVTAVTTFFVTLGVITVLVTGARLFSTIVRRV